MARATSAERVLAWFDGRQPETVEGSFALIRAHTALGQTDAARTEAVRAWIELPFTAEQEAALLEADATATNGDADGFGQAFAEEIEEISAEVDAATEAKAD